MSLNSNVLDNVTLLTKNFVLNKITFSVQIICSNKHLIYFLPITAARLVSHTPKFCHISPFLVDLHFCSSFKICFFMHKISSSSYYLLSVLAYGPLLALSSSLSLSLILTLKLLFLFLVYFSGTLFYLLLNLLLILFFLET